MAAVEEKLSARPSPRLALVRALRNVHAAFSTTWPRLRICAPSRGKAVPGLHQHHRHDAGGFDRVYLASGSSGKGLRAYPGLSMVFYHHDVPAAPEKLPRYLDLGLQPQARRHAVHVFIESAARAACRGQTGESGKDGSPKLPNGQPGCANG